MWGNFYLNTAEISQNYQEWDMGEPALGGSGNTGNVDNGNQLSAAAAADLRLARWDVA